LSSAFREILKNICKKIKICGLKNAFQSNKAYHNNPHALIAFEKIHFFRGVFALHLVLSEKVLYNDCIGAENMVFRHPKPKAVT
jgi:hypothetical protein